MLEIRLHKNEVDSYAYNNVNTLITQIERIIERQLFEDSSKGMKGLASAVRKAINDKKSTFHIKIRDVLTASRAASERANIEDITVEPEINTNSDDDEAIGVKEGIAEVITKIIGRDITNTILRTTDNNDFKSVNQYQTHQLFTLLQRERNELSRRTSDDSLSTRRGQF